jgi:iron-sulfur cluster repair protein YtfE (RIC family)
MADAFRRHHQTLLSRLSERMDAILEDRAVTDPVELVAFLTEELVGFLKAELLEHAAAEEQHLYPVVDTLLRTQGQATATMRVDHEFIRGMVGQIEETVAIFGAAPPEDRRALRRRLERLLLELRAVFRLHLEKEERVYVPLVERHVPEADQRRLLEQMHGTPQRKGRGENPEGQ